MTFGSILGPRQRRPLQKLDDVSVSYLTISCLGRAWPVPEKKRALVSILLVVLDTVSLFF